MSIKLFFLTNIKTKQQLPSLYYFDSHFNIYTNIIFTDYQSLQKQYNLTEQQIITLDSKNPNTIFQTEKYIAKPIN